MGFRAFLVMDNKVARQVMAENGRKWISACFPSWSSRWSCRQWSKWSKMGCRGYLVENGFPRVSRHSPTTSAQQSATSFLVFCAKVILLDRNRNDKSKIIQRKNNTGNTAKQRREFKTQISKHLMIMIANE